MNVEIKDVMIGSMEVIIKELSKYAPAEARAIIGELAEVMDEVATDHYKATKH